MGSLQKFWLFVCGYSLCGSCRVLGVYSRSHKGAASGNAARMHTLTTSCSNCLWRGRAAVAVVNVTLQLLVKLLPALVQKLATTQPKTRAKVGGQSVAMVPWEAH